jgi:MFS family permease
VVSTQFAVPFMISAVGVCLPAIGREFSASAIQLSLVESVFLCVNAMLLLPFGRAGDICGRGGVFLVGLAIFAASALALTLAPGMEAFLAIRGVQAFGGAMTLATGLALLYDAFPPEERGRALGVSVAGIYLGISAGPVLGGVIASALGWRFVFYVGMAPCLAALVVCLRNLSWKLTPAPGARFDWWGALTSAAGIGLLVVGSAHPGTSLGWWSLGSGAALCAAFILIERKSASPLLHLDLFSSNAPFSLGLAAMCIVSSAAFGVSFLLSLYLQYGRGMTPAQAGLVLAVQPVVQSVVSPLCGRLIGKTPVHVLSGIGAMVTVAGVALAALLSGQSGLTAVVGVLLVVGLGIGVFSTPSMVAVMSAVPPTRYGIASALSGQSRTTGMTACMAVITVVLARYVGDHPLGPEVIVQYMAAMRVLFAAFAAAGLVGAAMAFAGRPRAGATSPATSSQEP